MKKISNIINIFLIIMLSAIIIYTWTYNYGFSFFLGALLFSVTINFFILLKRDKKNKISIKKDITKIIRKNKYEK